MHPNLKAFKTLTGYYILSGPCIMCQIPRAVTIQAQELFNWQNGQLIQNAMPNLDSTDREFLISGICGKCFDKMFEDK